MPGGETMTKYTQTPNVDLANRAWNTVSGTAQTGGSANTIKLATGASSTNDFYVGLQITLTGAPVQVMLKILLLITEAQNCDNRYNFSATPTSSTTYSIKETWVPDWLKTAYPMQAATAM
jgi:hypothetical protein